jgi:CRP-like cAMP-binding protein
MMPEMDGYEVLYLLGKNPDVANIPFIFLTAKSEQTDLRKGMNLGADDYIPKPFEEIELLNAVERRLNRYEQLLAHDNLEQFVESARNYAELNQLEKEAKTRKFKKKDIIYRQGDFASYSFKIKYGKVKPYQINPAGKEFIHDILKDGAFLGENALIQDADRTEFAEALEDTELLLIPRKDFQDLIFQNRDVSGQFIKMLSQNLVEKEKELVEMAYDTVRKRTADALMKLNETYKSASPNVKFDISRSDLASMVGTATESVIRILSEFKKDGIIKIEGSTVHILNTDKLLRIKY